MANERLRRAIQQAGLRLEDVAEHVEIDVKTAERWITKGRLPHARNRVTDGAAAERRRARPVAGDRGGQERALGRATASWCASMPTAARCRTSAGTSCSRRRRERLDVLVHAGLFLPDGRSDLARAGAPQGPGRRAGAASLWRSRLRCSRAARRRGGHRRRARRADPAGARLHARGVRRAERGRAAARDDALQLDLPLRRRAAREQPRLWRACRAVARPASASASRAGGCSTTTWRASSASGSSLARSPRRRPSSWPARRRWAGGSTISTTRTRRRRTVSSCRSTSRSPTTRAGLLADPALGQRQLGAAGRRDGPRREHLGGRGPRDEGRDRRSTARSPGWSGSTRTRAT